MIPSHLKNPPIFRIDRIIGLALGALAFLVYAFTFSPVVQHEDGGELAAAFSTLGIAHPSGYPLLTLLGRAFVALPPHDVPPVWKLNLLMALLCALAVVVFYQVFLQILRFQATRVVASGEVPVTKHTERLAAVGAVGALAFSRVFWTTSSSVEVHALHLFFLAACTSLFLNALSRIAINPELGADRHWRLFVYVLGLAFTNHLTMVLLAPAFLYLYFITAGVRLVAWKRILNAVPLFLLGLSTYLYLPIRASAGPAVNWGDPDNLRRFIDHVTTSQYRFRMFSSWESALGKARWFFGELPRDFGWFPLVIGVLGVVVMTRRASRPFAFVSLIFITGVLYAVNYAFPDANFHLNAHFAVAIWVAWGIRALLDFSGQGRMRIAAWLLVIAMAAFPLAGNYRAVDESRNYAVADYAVNMLNSLDSGALILSEEEIHFLFPALYYQEVEGVRTDVAVLNFPLMLLPWYHEQLETRHPDLFENVQMERQAYLNERRSFEARRGRGGYGDSDSTRLSHAFRTFIQAILMNETGSRAVYVTRNIVAPEGMEKVPSGLAYRLFPDTLLHDLPLRTFNIRPFVKTTPLIEDIRATYAESYANQGLYRATGLGDTAAGVLFLRKALDLRPQTPVVREWLARLQQPILSPPPLETRP